MKFSIADAFLIHSKQQNVGWKHAMTAETNVSGEHWKSASSMQQVQETMNNEMTNTT